MRQAVPRGLICGELSILDSPRPELNFEVLARLLSRHALESNGSINTSPPPT
jgi:hypothetical protein